MLPTPGMSPPSTPGGPPDLPLPAISPADLARLSGLALRAQVAAVVAKDMAELVIDATRRASEAAQEAQEAAAVRSGTASA